MSEQREEKTVMNPYVFPGLKVNEKEKNRIFTKSLHRKYKVSKEELLSIISEETNVSVNQIVEKSRKREVVNARFIFCAILKNDFGYTLKRIGEEISGRDHTSIRHALIQYRNRMNTEEPFKILVNNIYSKIGYKSK